MRENRDGEVIPVHARARNDERLVAIVCDILAVRVPKRKRVLLNVVHIVASIDDARNSVGCLLNLSN